MGEAVEGEVQQKDVDSRLSQEPELPTLSVALQQRTDRRNRDVPGSGDPRHLQSGSCGRNVWIESGAGRRHHVCRDLSPNGAVLPDHPLYTIAYERVRQLAIGWTLVAPGRGGGVIAGPGSGWARMKVLGSAELLADQRAPDDLAAGLDKRTVRLPGKEHLGQAGHHAGIYQPGQNAKQERQNDGGTKLLANHRSNQMERGEHDIDQLDPGEGHHQTADPVH